MAYFTVIAPFLMLLVLFLEAVSLEGSGAGIRYYLTGYDAFGGSNEEEGLLGGAPAAAPPVTKCATGSHASLVSSQLVKSRLGKKFGAPGCVS